MSAFLCSLINIRVSGSYTHVELSLYFYVRHVVFIIRAGKTGLICKIHCIDGCITAILLHKDKVAIDG